MKAFLREDPADADMDSTLKLFLSRSSIAAAALVTDFGCPIE